MKNSPFRVESPEQSLGLLLWQVTITWQRQIRQTLAPYDLSHPQFVLLAILLWWNRQEKEVTQVTLIEMSKLDKMTVSKALKTLTERGLVSRKEHPQDSRAKAVCLTEQGVALSSLVVPKIEGTDAQFFSQLSEEEQSALNQSLCSIIPS